MPGERPAIHWTRRLLRSILRWMWLGMLFAVAGAGTMAVLLWPEWLEIRARTVAMAEAHRTYQTAHPGWSFPSRVYSDAFDITDADPAHITAQALARGYTPTCPPTAPGEVCDETGEVILRGGVFAEGMQPAGGEGWSRPPALEPILLGVLMGEDTEVRWHLPLEEAPPALLAAIIAAEDEDFEHHGGADVLGLIRAAIANARGGGYQQGASTLSMQVVRNLTQRREKTITRKLEEIAAAIALDQHLGKEGVLQMYLDAPYLGQSGSISICGFAAAARFYYGRDITALRLDELATLAGILPAPGRYAPSRDPQAAQQRRDLVLHRMADAGWDVTEALQQPIVAGEHPPLPIPQHPAFFQATRQWLEHNLPDETRLGAGLNVFTTMDVAAQVASETILPERLAYITEIVGQRHPDGLEAAGAIVSPTTGHLTAVYGGSLQDATGFSRATQARRQAGSSYKPVVYAMAFNQQDPDGQPTWRAHDTVPNARRVFANTNGWNPRNVGGEYSETTTLAQGVAWSQNIAAASLLEALGGPEPLIEFAAQLGFDTGAYPTEMGLALGQAEVTPLEQARFVATVLNGGHIVSGSPVRLARDPLGDVRLTHEALGPRVISEEAALLTRELMRLVIVNGTGGASRWGGSFPGYTGDAIGKTGTTDREKDLWFVGGTASSAAALWLGYDQPTPIGASASDLAAPMWGWWMRAVHAHRPAQSFTDPIPWTRRAVCTETGRYRNETCTLIGTPFLREERPSGTCDVEHPPPDPTHTGYEGLWRRRQREQAEQEAAERAAAGESTAVENTKDPVDTPEKE